MSRRVELTWPELVLHVLAHLEATAELPSSVYSECYVRAARQRLGPVSERELGRDLALLVAQLNRHAELAQVQLLTRLHPTLADARNNAHRELCSLGDASNTNLEIRDTLLATVPIQAELLRCSALLEAEIFERWPLPDQDAFRRALQAPLSGLWSVAPQLRCLSVYGLRVLGRRGRAFPDGIWVGIPDEPEGPSVNHVTWQAAHEATVLEVSVRARTERWQLGERQVEHLAVVLMERRARAQGMTEGHGAWLSAMQPGARAWADAAALTDAERTLLACFGDGSDQG